MPGTDLAIQTADNDKRGRYGFASGSAMFSFRSLRDAPVSVRLMALLVAAFVLSGALMPSAMAETRSLKLYFLHTGEKAQIVFKRNGRYDRAGLKKLNHFLRDWRQEKSIRMDPRLFDLIWEVYRRTGSNNYINVISAYRSPATNEMLRRTRGGQAKKSQHLLGKALDFYIPGVKLSKLRAIGMKVGGGGVGYYPNSGSPFVHLDVGGVRAWPRMSRQELTRLFPEGKTLHLPPDGRPLPGYKVALAAYKKRDGAIVSTAGGDSPESVGLLAALFGNGDDGDEGEAATPVPASRVQKSGQETRVAALPGVNGAEIAANDSGQRPFVLPEQVPLPRARPRIEPQGTAIALVAPPTEVPAQAQIDAFAVASAASPAEIRDLSAMEVPLPRFRPDQTLDGTGEREVAALTTSPEAGSPLQTGDAVSAVIQGASETFVPVPIRRPAALRPSVDVSRQAPVIVASLAPPLPEKTPERALGRIAAAFEPDDDGASTKGPRPDVEDAIEGRSTARRIAPKLTQTIISRWALTRDRIKTMSDPDIRGKRFVASQLRAAPEQVYALGFTHEEREQPYDQFTGAAVNFIKVARFSEDG